MTRRRCSRPASAPTASTGARDAGSAARMATWLAADQLDFHGAWAVASGWLAPRPPVARSSRARAGARLARVSRGLPRSCSRATPRGVRARDFAAELGRRFGVADLEMLGLALEGAALVAGAEIDEGCAVSTRRRRPHSRARPTIPISSAWACCFLVTACTAVLDFERAFEWCDRIAEFAERYGSRYMLGFCRAEYARSTSGEAGGPRPRRCSAPRSTTSLTRGPRGSVAPLVGLAELRRRQGRSAEASALLDQAGSSTRGPALPRPPGARSG